MLIDEARDHRWCHAAGGVVQQPVIGGLIVKAIRFGSAALVVAVFVAALVAGRIGDSLPAGSAGRDHLASLSAFGMGLTLALGLAVGCCWLLRDRSQRERSRNR